MKIYLYFIMMIVAMLSIIYACSQKKSEPFNISHDLLEEFRAQLQEATHLIDFRKEASPEKYLLHGWGSPEKGHIWATAKKSSVVFYSYHQKNDLEIEFSCKSALSKDNTKQIIEVLLNERHIRSFVAEPDKFRKFQASLPASLLKSGRNILQFCFSYTIKPRARDLSVAFKDIRFKNNAPLISFNDAGLLQRPGSSLSLLWRLPVRFEFDIHYQSIKGTTPLIKLSNERNENITIKLLPKNRTYKKTIHLKEEGIYKIQLMTDGSPDSSTVWSQIQVNMYKQEQGIQESSQGFSKLTKPDILLYVVDALRADHLGCYGYHRNTSPHIDRFAQENSLYENAYANASWTRASGASILTGLFPKNHKTMERDDKLPDNVVTLAETLQENGYYTLAFIVNDNIGSVFGFDQGFHEYRHADKDRDFDAQYADSHQVNKNSIFPFFKTYLEKKERPPFFMMVWTIDPHDPYTPPESVKDMFHINQYQLIDTYAPNFILNIRKGVLQPTTSQIEYMKTCYDQEIYFTDQSFGELLDTMKSFDIYNNTIIIFTSDHGEEFFEHGGVTHGYTLYNEQVEIPLIVKTPQIAKGLHKERVQHIDIYPSILDLLGIDEPYALDGVSLFRNTDLKRTLYFEEKLDGNDVNAVLDKKKKLIYNKSFNRQPSKEIIPVLELYDIKDIYEQHNLTFNSIEDELRLQELFSYRHIRSRLDLQQTQAEISPELDQKLKDLGYVK